MCTSICCTLQLIKEPALFPGKVLRRAIDMKALFVQCHTAFHTLSMTSINSMPDEIERIYCTLYNVNSYVQCVDGTVAGFMYCIY